MDTLTFTSGRTVATVAALIALAGVLLTIGAGRRPRRAAVAVAAGLTGLVAGGGVLAVADGGPGTGGGVVGAAAAVGLGLTAAALGGRSLRRARRAGPPVVSRE